MNYYSETICVQDIEAKLMALVVSHASTSGPLLNKLQALMFQLQATFPGELFPLDTKVDLITNFLALHFSWYNKFSESVRSPVLLLSCAYHEYLL